MIHETDDALYTPFNLPHLSLHGHVLFLDNCLYAWIDTDKHSSLHSLSLSTFGSASERSIPTTPVLCNNDACSSLSNALSARLKHPVLVGMGQGIDQLASEHIPEIARAIATIHSSLPKTNK